MALAAAIRPSKIKQLLIISNRESSIDEPIAYISAQLNSHAAALLSAQRQGHTIRAAHVDCVATRRYTACLGLHDGACLGRPRRGAAAPLPSLGAQSNCRHSSAATATRWQRPTCNQLPARTVCSLYNLWSWKEVCKNSLKRNRDGADFVDVNTILS